MRKTVQKVGVALLLLTSFAATAQEEQVAASSQAMPAGFERVDPLSWNFRLGAGTAIDPSVFWLTAHVEAQLDKFFAIGPTFQLGFGDLTTYSLGTIGPRFTLPFSYFEWFMGASAGISYRDQSNINFVNFVYEMNTGFEFYVMKYFSVGAAIRKNWISSNVVGDVTVVTGYLSGHF
ncbi:MAG: hypothetical protein KDK51_07675 [Deltaproteobacteria bacterium]|nr:hypothetical protein [Deltaproteobacteria bacterium]